MNPINHFAALPEAFGILEQIYTVDAVRALEPGLVALAVLRASQINGCGYCVKMHVDEARKAGVSNEKLDRLVVWRHVDDFTPAEKVVFEWVEALTRLDADTDYAPYRTALRAHYSDKEISALTLLVAMINLWNRIQISNH